MQAMGYSAQGLKPLGREFPKNLVLYGDMRSASDTKIASLKMNFSGRVDEKSMRVFPSYPMDIEISLQWTAGETASNIIARALSEFLELIYPLYDWSDRNSRNDFRRRVELATDDPIKKLSNFKTFDIRLQLAPSSEYSYKVDERWKRSIKKEAKKVDEISRKLYLLLASVRGNRTSSRELKALLELMVELIEGLEMSGFFYAFSAYSTDTRDKLFKQRAGRLILPPEFKGIVRKTEIYDYEEEFNITIYPILFYNEQDVLAFLKSCLKGDCGLEVRSDKRNEEDIKFSIKLEAPERGSPSTKIPSGLMVSIRGKGTIKLRSRSEGYLGAPEVHVSILNPLPVLILPKEIMGKGSRFEVLVSTPPIPWDILDLLPSYRRENLNLFDTTKSFSLWYHHNRGRDSKQDALTLTNLLLSLLSDYLIWTRKRELDSGSLAKLGRILLSHPLCVEQKQISLQDVLLSEEEVLTSWDYLYRAIEKTRIHEMMVENMDVIKSSLSREWLPALDVMMEAVREYGAEIEKVALLVAKMLSGLTRLASAHMSAHAGLNFVQNVPTLSLLSGILEKRISSGRIAKFNSGLIFPVEMVIRSSSGEEEKLVKIVNQEVLGEVEVVFAKNDH